MNIGKSSFGKPEWLQREVAQFWLCANPHTDAKLYDTQNQRNKSKSRTQKDMNMGIGSLDAPDLMPREVAHLWLQTTIK